MGSSSEKRRMPRTEEVALMAAAAGNVERLAGTILLDRYRLIELLGCGGAAAVYRAEHTIMHKALAVKVLRPECAVRDDFVRRFLAEARMVAKLRHDHIVDVVDIGRTENGIVFCVMECLDGETLADTILRDGPMPLPRATEIIRQVCSGLAAAHAVNVVHRDVKPENCFRMSQRGNADFIKLLDFGIAKQLDAASGLTNTGVVMGTAEYMSPEQARGSATVNERADIYSVGAMLFELLTGLPPFLGDGFLDVLMKHATEPVPRISGLVDGLPPALDMLMDRALAKDANDRFSSIEDFLVLLTAVGEQTAVARAPHPRIDPPEATSVPRPGPQGPPPEPPPRDPLAGPPVHHPDARRRHHRPAVIAAVVLGGLAIAGAVVAMALATSRHDPDPAPAGRASTVEADAPPSRPEPPGKHASELVRPEIRPPPHPTEITTPENDGRSKAEEAGTSEAHSIGTDNRRPSGRARVAGSAAIRRTLKRRIERACRRYLKFEDKAVKISVARNGKKSVTDTPHPYPDLQRCVKRNAGPLAAGTYRVTLAQQR